MDKIRCMICGECVDKVKKIGNELKCFDCAWGDYVEHAASICSSLLNVENFKKQFYGSSEDKNE